MKLILTLALLSLGTSAFGQEDEIPVCDSLAPIQLNYEVYDSVKINSFHPRADKKYPNFVSFRSGAGLSVAYYTTDKNKWISVLLNDFGQLSEYQVVNLDRKGQPEIIYRYGYSEYGSGGGTTTDWFMVINIDSIPIRLLNIIYGCHEESFGEKHDENHLGEGAYAEGYVRKITVTDSKIIIDPVGELSFENMSECYLTKIESGTYVMEDGHIFKKK